MKTRALVVGALMASFCIAVPTTAFAQQDILKAGGVDDEGVANAYYETIDPDNLRTTQDDWEAVNGFNDPLNEVVEATGYFNEGDLAFWRSIFMVEDKRPGYEGNIAFTTINYASEEDALEGDPEKMVSIVNMEYSPGPNGEDEDEAKRITKFYVYDAVSGDRQISTAFDDRGEALYLPAACFSCHGGDDDAEAPLPEGYNDGSGETNGTFLAFDVNTMTFGNTSLASLEAAFKKMNEAVLRTDPTKATRTLIKGLYGGSGLPRNTQDLAYIPTSWAGEEDLYNEVVVPSCRSCHTTSDKKLLSLSWWKANPDKIREVVFHEQTMPNSKPSYDRFWGSNQPGILGDALERFE
jgi:mono/diheme cytochrome c family protein